jgi:hypothetical protein
MSRENVLVLLALIVALTPFLGIPLAWLSILLPILALLIAGIAYSLRARRLNATAPAPAPAPAHEKTAF